MWMAAAEVTSVTAGRLTECIPLLHSRPRPHARSCRAGFNRAEYFLRLHSTPCEFTCARLPAYDRATATARSLAFQGVSESLTIARVMPPGTPADNATCLIGNADSFYFPKYPALFWQDTRFAYEGGLSARVLAEFSGTDGGALLVIDQVLFPTGHPFAKFPSCSLPGYLHGCPDTSLFYRLLDVTGLLGCLRHPTRGSSCPGGVPWTSRTLFAPTDAAFAKLSLGVLSWLFSPVNRPLARLIALVRVGTEVHATSAVDNSTAAYRVPHTILQPPSSRGAAHLSSSPARLPADSLPARRHVPLPVPSGGDTGGVGRIPAAAD